MTPSVLRRKFGGELLETGALLAALSTSSPTLPHSGKSSSFMAGGKEIDTALNAAGIEKRQVDGR